MVWTFNPQTRLGVSGENLAEPNFNREDREIENIFLREFDQNVLDARRDDPDRADGKAPARIKISLLTKSTGLDAKLLEEITAPLEPHLVAAGHGSDQRDHNNPVALVIEEFGTLGLTGKIDDTFADGNEQRWASFWFGEGKRIKSGKSLGRKGQGKIVYHVVSGARAVFAITRRHDESRELLFGKCIVQRTHVVNGQHYTQHGYWPKIDSANGDQPMPEEATAEIQRIKKGFSLTRQSESGTSWIVPYVPAAFNQDALVREFIRDFYFSVMRGALTADICGVEINESTIGELLVKCGILRPSPAYFSFMEEVITRPRSELTDVKAGWELGTTADESCLSAADLDRFREELQEGKLISLKLPIQVCLKGGHSAQSFLEVHLQLRPPSEATQELYVRSGLCIAEEKHLHEVSRSAFGIVLADDEPIADFLGSCEEASHLRWNNTEKGAKERFIRIRDTLSAVRRSMPKMFRLVAGSSEKQVKDALFDILSVPMPGDKKRKVKTTGSPGKKEPGTIVPPIMRKHPVIFSISDKGGRWILKPGKDAPQQVYPIELEVEFAYDQLAGTGNPWRSYHPYDFNVANETKFKVPAAINVAIQTREQNLLALKVESPDFEFELTGFSDQVPLLSRISYDATSTS
jgi:hypothetical protein